MLFDFGSLPVLFYAGLIWSMVWKGIALWRAGRNGNLGWYIVLFVINTAGILEIIYIFVFGKRKTVIASP
jgi:methionyl-tRNA synthetase